MRIAYWDCFSGIAGDMNLGAMIGCGLRLDDLREDLSGLALEGFEIRHRRVQRGSLAADKIDVLIAGEQGGRSDPGHEHHGGGHERGHGHHEHHGGGHERGHGHHEPHGGEHEHGHGHHHPPRRGLADIRDILERSDLPAGVAERADRVFEALCAAEASVHGCRLEEVHLHEVGAIDAIVDVVGACCGLRRLGIEAIRCSPLNVGGGTVAAAHGLLPVPAPATAYLLREAPVYSRGPEAELVTPTGAALVATLAEGFGPWPAMKVTAIGYGAGDREHAGLANVLRLVIGDSIDGGAESRRDAEKDRRRGTAGTPGDERDTDDESAAAHPTASRAPLLPVHVIETDIDDASPQLLGALIPRLLEAGALDANLTPLIMKKNRPGSRFTVIADAGLVDYLADIVLRESTTLGLRIYPVERRELDRHHLQVDTEWGAVRVKVGKLGGEVVNWAPEFDDCERIARAAGVAVKRVIQAAAAAYCAAAAGEEKAE
jgi:hypothetical protein